MTHEERQALRCEIISSTAYEISKVAKELSSLFDDNFIRNDRINLRLRHLKHYYEELEKLKTLLFENEPFFEEEE